MALSGKHNITLDSRGQVKSMIEWSATQSINNNSSTITVKVYSYFQYAIYASAAADVIVNIAGQSQTVSRVIGSHPNGVKKLVATVTKTVSHNSEGRLTARIRVTNPFKVTYSGQYINQANHDFNITLDTIDRESSVSVPASVTIPNSKPSVTITPKNSAFRHIADLEIGGRKIMTLNNLAGGTHTFNLSTAQENEILNIMKNTTSMEYSVVISTWNGNTRIGGYPRARGTLYIHSSIVPTISSVTHAEVNATLASKGLSVYVQNMSRVRVRTTASGTRGSTIKSIEVNVAGRKYSGSDITTDTVNVANTNNPWSAVITVTDTRNRSVSQTISKTVVVYTAPTASIESELIRMRRDYSTGYLDFVRDDENGTYLGGELKFTVTPLGNKNFPWNLLAEVQQVNTTTWEEIANTTINHALFGYSWGGSSGGMSKDPLFHNYEFEPLYSYMVRVTLTDTITQQVFLFNVPSGFAFLDFHHSGKGLAIGKPSEKQAFEVAMDAEFSGKVQSKDAITVFAPTENATDNVLQRFRRKDGTTHSVFMYNETDQALYLHLYSRTGWKTWFTFKDDGTFLAGGREVIKDVVTTTLSSNSRAWHDMPSGTYYVVNGVNLGYPYNYILIRHTVAESKLVFQTCEGNTGEPLKKRRFNQHQTMNWS